MTMPVLPDLPVRRGRGEQIVTADARLPERENGISKMERGHMAPWRVRTTQKVRVRILRSSMRDQFSIYSLSSCTT